EDIKYTLVYCAEKQVNILTKLLSELGLRGHKFDSTVSNKEREQILKSYAQGTIQELVAMKCLDEGVDVPNTRVAYFYQAHQTLESLFNVVDVFCVQQIKSI